MSLKRKMTEVAVDAFTEYVQEKVEWLRQFDLDEDGQKDIDQILEILQRISITLKDALTSTDIAKIASGIEQIVSGATLIGKSVDRNDLRAVGRELSEGLAKISHLSRLGLEQLRDEST
jgi:hypothetical protein